jgi:hypothetical protein
VLKEIKKQWSKGEKETTRQRERRDNSKEEEEIRRRRRTESQATICSLKHRKKAEKEKK